jgi:hypothetical protein
MESSRCFSAEWTFEKGLRSVGTRGHGETRRPRRFQTTDVTRHAARGTKAMPPSSAPLHWWHSWHFIRAALRSSAPPGQRGPAIASGARVLLSSGGSDLGPKRGAGSVRSESIARRGRQQTPRAAGPASRSIRAKAGQDAAVPSGIARESASARGVLA